MLPHGDNFADKFVANDQRWLNGGGGPGIPGVDVDIGPANGSLEDADKDIIRARFRLRNILQDQAGSTGCLYYSTHDGKVDIGDLLGKVPIIRLRYTVNSTS